MLLIPFIYLFCATLAAGRSVSTFGVISGFGRFRDKQNDTRSPARNPVPKHDVSLIGLVDSVAVGLSNVTSGTINWDDIAVYMKDLDEALLKYSTSPELPLDTIEKKDGELYTIQTIQTIHTINKYIMHNKHTIHIIHILLHSLRSLYRCSGSH